MEIKRTNRGFAVADFVDGNGKACSIQESSAAEMDYIWLGLDDADPSVLASQAASLGVQTEKRNGWVPYPIPPEVLLNTRMHLTREQVKELIPLLKHFVKKGYLPREEKASIREVETQ